MIIRHNMMAMNANRQLNITNKKKAKTTERLSSGYKINRAADDAAGLAISEKMRRLVHGLNQASQNVQEGIGYIQVADGALNEVHDILHRMNELAVKSANGTNQDDDRKYLDSEVQQLKEELDRIFNTTSYNERLIWEPDPKLKTQIGVKQKQAVNVNNTNNYPNLTNANCGVLAYNGYYTINVTGTGDTDGINISWTGYNGTQYTTQTIDWLTLEDNNYIFEMSDYFDPAQTTLFDTNGKPVFTHKVSFTPEETATRDNIKDCLNDRTISGSTSASMTGRFEDASGTSVSNDFKLADTYLYYSAAFASNHNTGTTGTDNVRDFDAADDAFLTPADGNGNKLTSSSTSGNITEIPVAAKNKDVAAARTSSDKWKITFDMDGIGKVTAESSRVTYWASSDFDDDDYDYWWHWQTYYVNGVKHERQVATERSSSECGAGTLGAVMATLTGKKGVDSTPGLLTNASGDSEAGGWIQIRFNMTSENAYTYGDNKSSSNVGYFELQIQVTSTDTEQSVLNKISNALNQRTVFDLYSSSANSDSAYIGTASPNSLLIDVPIYGGGCQLIIQAGAEVDDKIHILYDSLSTIELGLTNTNVLTQDSCAEAISDIEAALGKVSAQRAAFGAYQNRLEHAYNNNKNIEENTQAAESQIRDTDMALAMVEHSNLNILQQAGQAMLAQTNTTQQAVLHLIQNL